MKHQISNPSQSIVNLNVPDVRSFSANFVYNFFTVDERITPHIPASTDSLVPDKYPKYSILTWEIPKKSTNDSTKTIIENNSKLLYDNLDKIICEDNFVNSDFISHTFSDISVIEQGSNDLENYARISNSSSESIAKMSAEQLKEILGSQEKIPEEQKGQLSGFSNAYSSLSNLPQLSLGLRVFDKDGKNLSEGDFLRTLLSNVSLNLKINRKISSDIFRNSKIVTDTSTADSINKISQISKRLNKNTQSYQIKPATITSSPNYQQSGLRDIRYVGYIIERFVTSETGLLRDKVFIIGDVNRNDFLDFSILYGKSYFYSIRLIAVLRVLSYDSTGTNVIESSVLVSSRPTSSAIECFEYEPPPPPHDIRFFYDYQKKNLAIVWDQPQNPQDDIKQYQVLRRKSIKEPFELIAQYSFDDSSLGPGQRRYTTGEIIDGNDPERAGVYGGLITQLKEPAHIHRDTDFIVDTEFYESPTYIYALCSVDAHGMISNYSTQYQVTFDVYKNKLNTEVICDEGSIRSYPNMKLRLDAFKDVINIRGQSENRIHLYVTPEYLRVSDDRGIEHKIFEAETSIKPNEKPFYVMQMINVDNQKSQILKIVIKDPDNFTT